MNTDELKKKLAEHPTVPLWPDAGKALGLKRGQTYACGRTGDIEVLEFGRLKLVASAWLQKTLGF
jgi:hypothetical protein